MESNRTSSKRHKCGPLMKLPLEVQSMITDNVMELCDLSRLSRTCRTFHAIIFPRLFQTISLALPVIKEDLSVLENLVSSDCNGLQYTRSILIRPNHSHATDGWSFRRLAKQGHPRPEIASQVVSSTTDCFNVLLRVLIRKLPTNCLETFYWRHVQKIEPKTFHLILRSQWKSLRCLEGHYFVPSLNLRRKCINIRSLTVNSLHTSDILDFEDCEMNLLLGSIKSLDSLTIGFEQQVFQGCEHINMPNFWMDGGTLSVASRSVVVGIVSEMQQHAYDVSKLLTPESLRLTSFDCKLFFGPSVGSFLDLSRLSTLALESCMGVGEALDILSARPAQHRFRPSQLRSLTIRAEVCTFDRISAFEGFICSLSELTDLCLLFEYLGAEELPFSFKDIMSTIGKTLKTLVVESRYEPRSCSRRGTSWTSWSSTNLESLCAICDSGPNLVELGLALDWKYLSSSEGTNYQVAMVLQNLKQLKVLNVRNMPEADNPSSWFAVERMFKALAASVVDLTTLRYPWNERHNLPKLSTVALGALIYRDVYVGDKWYSRLQNDDEDNFPEQPSLTPFEEFNQLRVYQVDHGSSAFRKSDPTLTLMSKGSVCDDPSYRDIKILKPYWLR